MKYLDDIDMLMECESISEFEEWQSRVEEELQYMMDQPATSENLEKIGAMIDYYFCNNLFHHDDHEVEVFRCPDGGIRIDVMMKYGDPEDYHIDFGVDHGVDFEIRLETNDILPWEETAYLDGCIDPLVGDDLSQALAAIEERVAQQRIVEALCSRVAGMTDEKASTVTESPDDILFAPIQAEDKKKAPEKPKEDYYYDGD